MSTRCFLAESPVTAIVLSLLLAQGDFTPAPEDGSLQSQLDQAWEHEIAEEYEQAVSLFTEVVDAANNVELRTQARYGRAWVLQERLGRPEEAINDLRFVINQWPEDWAIQELLADAYESIGAVTLARNTREKAESLRREILGDTDQDQGSSMRDVLSELLSLPQRLTEWIDGPEERSMSGRILAITVVSVGLWLAHTLLNIRIGQRQKQQANGMLWRLVWVSAAIGAMQTAPLLLILILLVADSHFVNRESLLSSWWLIWLWNWSMLLKAMGPPVSRGNGHEALPLVEDEGFMRRVDELASRMKLPTPTVRLLRSTHGELATMAFAGGLPAPSLVVSDGILHRLQPDERDAIVGHELAHLANGSIWYLLAARSLGSLFAVLLSAVFPPLFALCGGLFASIGVYRIVSRYFEYDCDDRAAEVLGYRTTVNALAKIHAAHFIRNTGWLSYLIYATTTHPSRDERLAALYEQAPKDDQPQVTWDPQEVKRRQVAARIALCVWAVLLPTVTVWKWWFPALPFPTLTLLIATLTPIGLIFGAHRYSTRHERRRQRFQDRGWGRAILIGTCSIIAFLFLLEYLSGGLASERFRSRVMTDPRLIFAIVGLLGFALLLFAALYKMIRQHFDRSPHEQEVIQACADHNFERVIELSREYPQEFQKFLRLRHNLALSEAILGNRKSAIERLEKLWMDEPQFIASAIVLSVLLFDEERPLEALSVCEQVIARLPNDPSPQLLRAWYLSESGRLDEAETDVRAVLSHDAECGDAYAILSAVEFDRGHDQEARRILTQAEMYAPGTTLIQYLRARQAVKNDDVAQAKIEVQKAIAASDANPFALMQKRVQLLAVKVGIAGDIEE